MPLSTWVSRTTLLVSRVLVPAAVLYAFATGNHALAFYALAVWIALFAIR